MRTFFLTHIKTNKMTDEHVEKRKLSDDEKDILIDFFEKNKPLWSSRSQFRDKKEKDSTKEKLVKLFWQKAYSRHS